MPALPISRTSPRRLKRELTALLARDERLADECRDAIEALDGLRRELKMTPRNDRPAIRLMIVQAKDEVTRLGCQVLVLEAKIDRLRARIEAGG